MSSAAYRLNVFSFGLRIAFVSFLLALGLCSGSEAAHTDIFRVRGKNVIDGSGHPVMLRGLNVEFKDFRTILGEEDIAVMAASGANMIRLVIDSSDLEKNPFRYDANGFKLLDRILMWCERKGLYVILDMHRVPGNQNTHDFVVHREKRALFWEDKKNQRRFYALWREIARRYKDRGVVAGYDLLNEGVCPSEELYKTVITKAAEEIRKEDRSHMLIVEEAILPGWRKKLITIEDENVLYSIHYFHPPEFTFYMTTGNRPLITYPGSVVTAGAKLGEARAVPLSGTAPWKKITITAAPPSGAEILMVKITSEGNKGKIWFDDISLENDGSPVDLPAPLVPNGSFDIDYPGFSWTIDGFCAGLDRTVTKKGERSLRFRNCQKSASVRSSPISVQGGSYVLTAWYKAQGATGRTEVSLSWHKGERISTVSREDLLREIRYALDFKERHGIPLYVGEFTAHLNPSPESVSNYLRDLLAIMEREGLHWSFWEYYSVYRGVGIFGGSPPAVVNPAAWNILRRYMKRE